MVPVFSLSTMRNIFLTKTSLAFIPKAAANSCLVNVVAMSLAKECLLCLAVPASPSPRPKESA